MSVIATVVFLCFIVIKFWVIDCVIKALSLQGERVTLVEGLP